jgi:hypothetical protein
VNQDRELSDRLQAAVRGVKPPAHLEARVRAAIRTAGEKPPRTWRMAWAFAAACCVAGIAVYAGRGFRQDAGVSSIMRVGLGDHVHCAVPRKFGAPPPIENVMADMGGEYAPLVNLVREKMPAGFAILQAHQCRYQGRRFVHVTARTDGSLVSLVIARKEPGESFAPGSPRPVLQAAGIPLYGAHADRYEIASFESRDQLIYIVSDLPRRPNLAVAEALAPAVRNWLAQREAS